MMSTSVTPKEFFKFCPRCGVAYTNASFFEEFQLQCQNCGFVFYQNPKAATGALILNEQQELLLVERAIDPGKGTWDIPGGFISWGEDSLTAICRELNEELHITFQPRKILSVVHSWYDYGGIHNSALNICYLGSFSGELKVDSDVSGFRWFPLDQLPENISFPEMKELFRQLKIELGVK